MIPNISGNSMQAQGHQHSHQTNNMGSSQAPQPAIRSPETDITVNNRQETAPAPKATKSAESEKPESKKSDSGEGLGDIVKKLTSIFSTLFSGITSAVSGLLGMATKLTGMIK